MNTNFNLTQDELFGVVKPNSEVGDNSNSLIGWLWVLGGITLTLSVIAIQQNQIRKKLEIQLKSKIG